MSWVENKYSEEETAVDCISTIAESDTILHTQFLKSSNDPRVSAEHSLMAALLSEGIESYLFEIKESVYHHPILNELPYKFEAIQWVEAIEEDYIFSFNNVCESLGISPDYLRCGLLEYGKVLEANLITLKWKKIRRSKNH